MGGTYRSARLPAVAARGSPAGGRRPWVACARSPPVGRLRAVAARGRGRFFSRARRQSVSPRGETDRGDGRTDRGVLSVRVGACLKRTRDGDWRQVLEELGHDIKN
ncbi:hypothetical protein GW17_00012370 [Ensete ventricosum]|nr:hypothetical protein GW17_00012370 [Ensete ventricosum]